IAELQKTLESATSQGARNTIQESILALDAQNEQVLNRVVDNMSKIDKTRFDRLKQITKEQAQLKAKAKEIKNDTGIPLEQKKRIIEGMTERFNSLENTRSAIIEGTAELGDLVSP